MNDEQLVEDYLSRLGLAAAGLPPVRRDELIAHTAARITAARADGPQRGTAMAALHTRNVLEDLGDPADIVLGSDPRRAARAARSGSGRARRDQRGSSSSSGLSAEEARRRAAAGQRVPLTGHEVAALILLVGGGLLAGIGWLVGVVLLWTSPRWKIGDKLLGTLVWPGGVAGALVGPAYLFFRQVVGNSTACSFGTPTSGDTASFASQPCPLTSVGFTLPGWLAVTAILLLVGLAIVGSTWTAVRLIRRGQAAPAGSAPAVEVAVR